LWRLCQPESGPKNSQMVIFKQAETLGGYLADWRGKGGQIGFAPTMGALHLGHLSLMEAAKKAGQLSVCSIFVNPTQFNNPADLAKYPVTVAQDIALLEAAGCEVLFLPSVTEIYPNGTAPGRHYELGYLETVLEGPNRPGHFQGVCQVVQRLLEIVRPHTLYLGQKDYQQCMVLRQLVRLLQLPVEVVTCPTLREPDGLAMSSRNMRLSPAERQQAVAIPQTLQWMLGQLQPGSLHGLKQAAAAQLTALGFKVDYVEVADADTLELLDSWDGKRQLVVLVAAFLGEVRLIDNMVR
jgi:pantoate--beta-alanine ligase